MSRRSMINHRGFVLVAVLVIVGSALLVTTSMLFTSSAEFAAARVSAERAQARALAWSGLQAIMSRLHDQRQRIYDGDGLELDEQYTIFSAGSRLGVARLLPCGPGGARLVPEGGKVDVNQADATALMATGLIDAALAEAIVSCRDTALARPFQSVNELLLVEGMTPELLFGDAESAAAAPAGFEAAGADASLRCLADLLTIYACEPARQRSGAARINLNVPWSDDLARAVDARFGAGESALLKQVFDSGMTFDTEAKLFEVMRTFKVETQAWPAILDTFTTDAGAFHFGRLDINTATREALLALPGLTPEQADRIVEQRQSLAPGEKATIAWPTLQGIIPTESYDTLAGRITTRSWAYRIRLASGEVSADDDRGELEAPMIFEAVIDLASSRPRLAYLRDVTMLDTMLALARTGGAHADDESELIDAAAASDGLPEPAALVGDEKVAATMPKFDLTPFGLLDGWGESADSPEREKDIDALTGQGIGTASGGIVPESQLKALTGRRYGRWRRGG